MELVGNPEADTALVAIGTIGDSAQELVADDDNLLVVRVHTYRPFPAAELASVLAGVSYLSVVDRAPGFGSLGPLGNDVLSLDLKHVKAAANFISGLGGADVTPAPLRWALAHTRSSTQSGGVAPVYVPEGV